jgi:hypothetical protein
MPRKAYKVLYLSTQHELLKTQAELVNATNQLLEINAALAPYGRTTLEAEVGATGEIVLAPLEFVAARAFMEATQRVIYPNGGFSQLYTWRGRPIYKRQPTKDRP